MQHIKVVVPSLVFEQLVVIALLHYFAVRKHYYGVGVLYGGKAIGGAVDLDDNLDEKTAMAAELISSSVKRVAEYSMDIAEIAINSVMD